MVIKRFLALNRVAKLYGFCHKQGRGSWCQRHTPDQPSLKYHPGGKSVIMVFKRAFNSLIEIFEMKDPFR